MWLPTVPTRAQPESSAAPSTARRSRATSLRSPRSWARVARAGVELCGGASAATAFVAALAVVFLAAAVALAAVPVVVSVAVLVALAVARRRLVVGGAGSSSGDTTASAGPASARPGSAWPLGEESRLSTRKRVQALWNGWGVLASPKP